MILIFWFTVAALATWRLASLIARERGAFGLLMYLRWCFGVEHDANGAPLLDEDGDVQVHVLTSSARFDALLWEIGRGLTCVWCNSLWIALLIAAPILTDIVPVVQNSVGTFAVVVLALSGAAILFDRIITEG